jgi:cell division protein FtsB
MKYLALVLLAGCATTEPPAVPGSDQTDIATLGNRLDKSDQRVAAAVTVARENADKPDVVRAETGVALAYLPKPDNEHIGFARNRASRASEEEYKRAEEAGRRLLAVIDADFKKAEESAKASKVAIESLNKQIVTLKNENANLKAEIAQTKKDVVTYVCAGLGSILALAAVGMFWMRQFIGGISAAAGSAALLAFPSLVETAWFLPSLGVLGASILIGTLSYLMFFKPKPVDESSSST